MKRDSHKDIAGSLDTPDQFGVQEEEHWQPAHLLPDQSSDHKNLPAPFFTEWPDGGETKSLDHPAFVEPNLPDGIASDPTMGSLARIRLSLALKLSHWLDQLAAALRREQELGNFFNLAPVSFASGIVLYYQASAEPRISVLLASAIVPLIGLFIMQSRGLRWFALSGLFFLFAGMALAQWQVIQNSHPVPLSGLSGTVRGEIIVVDSSRSGAPRYLIHPDKIEGLSADEMPPRIRVSARKGQGGFEVGDRIEGLARLSPLNGPAYPGGYDFAFNARMKGLGLTGFFMGAPQHAQPLAEHSTGDAAGEFSSSIEMVRQAIAERIRAGLAGEPGNIVIALVTGDRSGLSEDTQESLRRSGLAHILAISGLHMALVTLTVIWIMRTVLILIPGLAERHPIRKYAIIAGFTTATAYLMISGQGIATLRAWLMISVMLAASLMDRRAITMRSVAIAALLILVTDPASLFQPGFQMSFAAVAALVAVYQEWTRHKGRNRRASRFQNRSTLAELSGNLMRWFGGLSTTSLVAGTATALFALWHFHRVAPMGLVSNLLAMPIVSIAVMPLALLAMLLMPYGFEKLALKPLGMAVESVMGVSDRVNAYELDFETGLQPVSVLAGAALFLVLACSLRTRLRLLALAPLLAVIAGLSKEAEIPDLLIAQDGRAIAVRIDEVTGQGAVESGLALLYPRRSKFITDIWRRAYVPNGEFAELSPAQRCDADGCRFEIAHESRRVQVALVYDPADIRSACQAADILLAPRLWWVRCGGERKPDLILRRSDFEARGSHVVFLTADGFRIETAWRQPQSDFERRQAEQNQSNAAMPAARSWLRRFDNISRRFEE